MYANLRDGVPLPSLMSTSTPTLVCRATEKFISSEYLKAFSTPFTGIRRQESGGTKNGLFVDPGSQREGGVASATIVHDVDLSVSTPLFSENGKVPFDSSVFSTRETFRGPSQVGSADGVRFSVEPPGASMASTSCATESLPLNCVYSKIEHTSKEDAASRQLGATPLDAGGIADCSKPSVMMPHSLGNEVDNEQGDSNMAQGGNHARCDLGEGVVKCAETTLITRQVLGEGMVVDAVDELDVGAADWLDATHALLAGVTETGREGI